MLMMLLSASVVFAGPGPGLVALRPAARWRAPTQPDVLERLPPEVFALLRRKYFVDEIYEALRDPLQRLVRRGPAIGWTTGSGTASCKLALAAGGWLLLAQPAVR